MSSDFSESVSDFSESSSDTSNLIDKPELFNLYGTEIILDPEKFSEYRKRIMWYSLTEETIQYFSHYEVEVNGEIQHKPETNNFIYTFDKVGKYDFRIRGVDVNGDKTQFSDVMQYIVKNPE